MAITFGLPLVLLWLLLAVIPIRNPSARRLWIGIYAGISLIALLIAYLYSADQRRGLLSESTQDQYLPLILAALMVGPGLIAVLIRLVVSRPDPTPPIQQYAPYPPPYTQQPYPPTPYPPTPYPPTPLPPPGPTAPPVAPPPPNKPPTA
ncbi:hypothetical protein ACGFW5_26045 [Streptomyces sp. NPDC048416]|uniref:hypothetical protein n=1 Tax=Streptomyces sp. NPDC048416 TaxID=3365546 RepID=UPI00371BF06F